MGAKVGQETEIEKNLKYSKVTLHAVWPQNTVQYHLCTICNRMLEDRDITL